MSGAVSLAAGLQERVSDAKARLDAHTREVVAWHFDPASGCPFWLEFAKSLDFDPRKETRRYEDLDRFPPFQDEWLRGGPVRRWVPGGLAGKPIYVFETGGSTGVPKSRINSEDFRIDYEMFSQNLDDAYFPPGADWLMLGPSGPRRLRLAVEHLAQHRGGICFCIDLDPRWVVKLAKHGRVREMHEYKAHVIDQALTVLRAHPNVQCLFATPKLLEALCEKVALSAVGIRGVFCGGTQMTPQFHRFAREELCENGPCPADAAARKNWKPKIDFVPTYGNTLMGLACHKPFDPADNHAIIYHPPVPRAMVEVVEPEGAEQARTAGEQRVVAYGQTGRARLTTLTREFFMPRFLERDECERTPPCEKYPWDGVANVRPFSGFATPIVEGVY